MIADVYYDLRYALRMLRKRPGFTLVAVLTLALGIGANAAIFSLTDAVLLQSLPVKDPDQLTTISSYEPSSGPNLDSSFSYPMYQDLRDKNDVFSGVLARGGAQMNMSYEGRNDRVRGELVSGNYFEVLGVRPWAGRLFTQDDDRTPGAHPVAVLSYGFWERRFGKDLAVVGKTILVNETPLTVIGVSPPGFYGIELASNADVRVPLMMTLVFNPLPKTRLQSRRHQWLTVMARRKDGVTLAQAESKLEVVYQQIRAGEAQQLPADTSATERQRFFATKIRLQDGSQGFQYLQREMKTPLLLLFGSTCIVLLILCANLANLMLARDAARDQEIAVRLALGAGRLRLLRQWLTEAILLSVLGAITGVLVASWIKTALLAFMPPDYRMNLDLPLGWRFIGFTLLVSLVVGVVLGLAPALRAARGRSALALRGESRTFVSGGGLFSLRSGLILMQVALSLPLLIVSALFLNSLQKLRGVDTGFSKSNVLIASINPTLNGYSQEKTQSFYRDLLLALRALPGVQSASLSSDSPISGGWDQEGLVVEGYQPAEGERVNAQSSIISPDYFRSLGITLVAGRDFNDQDTAGTPKVAIINETMARKYFGSANPIGRKIGTDDKPDTVIVGVVRDAQYLSLREPALRHFFEPIAQQPRLFDLTMHIKTADEPTALVDLVRAAMSRVSALPGVERVAVSSGFPLGRASDTDYIVEGQPPLLAGRAPVALRQDISEDYHKVLNIPLLAGRLFTAYDTENTPLVVIVDEELAARSFPNQPLREVVGKRLRFNGDKEDWRGIVGVVRHVKQNGLDEESRGQIYRPLTQMTSGSSGGVARATDMIVKTSVEPYSLIGAIKNEIKAIDKDQPIAQIQTISDKLSDSVAPQRFTLQLLGLFGLIALLLAAAGIYGVISYAVTQRTHEIGIRMALGAQMLDVLKLVVRGGMSLVLIGVVIGFGGAMALTRLMSKLLFGVTPTDPLTFVCVAAGLTLVALIACYIPARKASRVDPLVALRYE